MVESWWNSPRAPVLSFVVLAIEQSEMSKLSSLIRREIIDKAYEAYRQAPRRFVQLSERDGPVDREDFAQLYTTSVKNMRAAGAASTFMGIPLWELKDPSAKKLMETYFEARNVLSSASQVSRSMVAELADSPNKLLGLVLGRGVKSQWITLFGRLDEAAQSERQKKRKHSLQSSIEESDDGLRRTPTRKSKRQSSAGHS